VFEVRCSVQASGLIKADSTSLVDFHTIQTIIGSDNTTFLTLKTKWGASMEKVDVFMGAPKQQVRF
jgi:hypothetical protein